MARPKAELVRVVRGVDGHVAVDPTGRLNGRGAYLCAGGTCRQEPKTIQALGRALHAQLPPELLTALAAAPDRTTTEGGARGQE